MKKNVFTFVMVVLLLALAVDYFVVPTLAEVSAAACNSGQCSCSCAGQDCKCNGKNGGCTCECDGNISSTCGHSKDGPGDEGKLQRPG
ncbi:MAG: hypothetical protein GY765_20600 [bacterium]|nr:hypothetical protein [bacterium]